MNYELRIRKIKQLLPIVLLISMAIVERLWWDLGPNIELVTLATFIAAFYLSRKAAVFIGISALVLSDIFIGNTNIALFTWSAYAVIALGAGFLRQFGKTANKKIFWATGGGILASLWFYVWTNFGVWLLDGYGMYPDTLNGLAQSYINGLPFLKLQLTGNLLIIPTGFGLIEIIKNLNQIKKFNHINLHGRLRI